MATTTTTMMKAQYETDVGWPHPLGAIPDANGVRFTLYARHATAVDLLLFDEHDDLHPIQVIPLDPQINKTFHFWHVYIKGAKAGLHYAYRVDGPNDPDSLRRFGHRYNKNKVLIDPYALGNTATLWDRGAACGPDDNLATSMRSVVIDLKGYDWEGDEPINRPMSETIIYEMHVGGFTRSPTSGVKNPGTFAGVVEKIPYLKSLGVTAVELLPVFEFDSSEVLRTSPITGKPLRNFWGYSTVSFMAPEDSFCVNPEGGDHITEFRDMVKALHKAGIEVILDVVFNHTSEGNHQGPTINFRGFDNSVYYHLVQDDKQYYMDYSGCGNTVNCNHPVVEKMILDCLEFWVRDMHVDGFRFDEGSILSRGQNGAPLEYPPVVWHIELSEILADTKIIAEAWDAAGLYQVGYFPGLRWAEWNGRFRDDVRRFVKGEPGLVGGVASRMTGSADLYQASGHLPINSVNFVTCHDGFTLNDLVTYNEKHNEANGEGNNDGANDNNSWNCGVEGPTDDPWIEELRNRQVKNMAAILLLSQGVPMITGGDEIRRTQQGNNNAYCQDSEISWYDWTLTTKYKGLFRFFQSMIKFRKEHRNLHRKRFLTSDSVNNPRGVPDIVWHGCRLNGPGFNDPNCRILAFTMGGVNEEADLHVMMNMEGNDLDFDLPAVPGRKWYRAADTGQPAPNDFLDDPSLVDGPTYNVKSHGVVVLISKDIVENRGDSADAKPRRAKKAADKG